MKNEQAVKLKQLQEESAGEKECIIPFSRRDFALITLISGLALQDADVVDTIGINKYVLVDDWELDSLKERLGEFIAEKKSR